jgi:hypothetical protein
LTDKSRHMPQSLPVVNYGSAIARAVEWLGDRYLLAKPVKSTQSRVTGGRAELSAVWQSHPGAPTQPR